MRCGYFEAGVCRSCTLLEQPYDEEVRAKQDACVRALGDPDGLVWLPPVTGPQERFRNKAKLVVGGTVDAPTLGILDGAGRGVDLRDCGLYEPAISDVLEPLARWIAAARLVPYDVPSRVGELKHVLLTASPDGELMLRLVLRSTEALARIRKHLPALQQALPALAVASVNVQPAHAAVLEGEREIPLTERQTLRMRVNEVDLHLRPRSFFQTNTAVAAALYRQAAAWIDEVAPATVWDLYCGVGGFALHATAPGREVTGVEVSSEAVASAEASAAELGLAGVRFLAGDATAFAQTAGAAPDLVVVNPPRRGLGAELAGWLESSSARSVLYSSCNPDSLARDLAAMPSWRPRRARLLDMFPQTTHAEVLVLLGREG